MWPRTGLRVLKSPGGYSDWLLGECRRPGCNGKQEHNTSLLAPNLHGLLLAQSLSSIYSAITSSSVRYSHLFCMCVLNIASLFLSVMSVAVRIWNSQASSLPPSPSNSALNAAQPSLAIRCLFLWTPSDCTYSQPPLKLKIFIAQVTPTLRRSLPSPKPSLALRLFSKIYAPSRKLSLKAWPANAHSCPRSDESHSNF